MRAQADKTNLSATQSEGCWRPCKRGAQVSMLDVQQPCPRYPRAGLDFGVPLTRIQVARRLGKSIATVRRLEGRVLFPHRDWRGVHRFDEWEVERLQRNPDRLKQHARSRWFQRALEGRRARRPAKKRASNLPPPEQQGALADALELLLERFAEVDLRALIEAGVDDELIALMLHCVQEARGAPLE